MEATFINDPAEHSLTLSYTSVAVVVLLFAVLLAWTCSSAANLAVANGTFDGIANGYAVIAVFTTSPSGVGYATFVYEQSMIGINNPTVPPDQPNWDGPSETHVAYSLGQCQVTTALSGSKITFNINPAGLSANCSPPHPILGSSFSLERTV